MKTLAHELISALAELDARIPQLGLYACHEYKMSASKPHPYWKTEWDLALHPRLAALGCAIQQQLTFERRRYVGFMQPVHRSIRFRTPTNQICDLRLIRTSKVKVRRYGSGYHIDRTVDFEDRWAQLKMEKQIRQIWWPDQDGAHADIRMLLFQGFDKANRPFHSELTQLEKSARWADRQITYQSKSWPDTHGRDFNILAACWTSTGEKEL